MPSSPMRCAMCVGATILPPRCTCWWEAVFWFHPAVWWIGARLLEERERACDEAVLQSGNEAEVYAEGILGVCKLYVESPLACVSGISGSDLKKRIVRIMTQRFADRLQLRQKVDLGDDRRKRHCPADRFRFAERGSGPCSVASPGYRYCCACIRRYASIKPNKSGDNMVRMMIRPGRPIRNRRFHPGHAHSKRLWSPVLPDLSIAELVQI